MKRFISWFALSLAITASGANNVLLIIADDFGADASIFYNATNTGAKLPPTPNLASLASQGVVFANAYANPVCSPTPACLLTGRYSFRTGIGDAIVGAGGPQLSATEFTLPEAFHASGLGYHLAQFGKWHLAAGNASPSSIGGWTNFSGSIPGAAGNYTNWTKVVNGAQTLNYTNYATTDVVDDAVNWIQARGTNAWFAWVAFHAGHAPLHKPPANLAPHYTSLSGTTFDINNHPENYFDAMIEAMDTEIGRLLAAVDRANTRAMFLTGRVAYNLGRIVTYALLGALFGLLGQTFVIAGLQRWVSLVAGAAILISLLLSPRLVSGAPLARGVGWLKAALGKLLQRRAVSSRFGIGLLNGLLPCGLVYAACAGATASGGFVPGIEYMVLFGLGTLPMMLAFSVVGKKLHLVFRFKLQRLIPASLAIVGLLLLLRGLALGIPYLSPKLPAQPSAAHCCH